MVIGGGAAGIFAAIHCAENNPQLQVTVLEAGRELLSKVKISGGGRCNVTHNCFDPAILVQNYPRGGKALRGAFSRFQPSDTIAWFTRRGVKLKTEKDGRIFPVSDNSQTIIDCLLQSTNKAGVKLLTSTPVKQVSRDDQHFVLRVNQTQTWKCDRLLLATGGHPLGYRLAQQLGHQLLPPVPSLFTFTVKDPRLEGLAGLTIPDTLITLPEAKLSQRGPLLLTHWGLSGPVVLKLSAWGARSLASANYQMPLVINWLPEYSCDSLRHKLLQLKQEIPKKQLDSISPLGLPKRLWQRFLHLGNIPAKTIWAQLSKSAINYLARELTKGEFVLQGKGIFKEEFVTCGGVNLKEVDFQTMASKICPNLYLAGEILDVDGVTGGFNFQNAWTTGYLAGQGLSQVK